MNVQTNRTSIGKPGKVRYVVLAGICLLYFISYLDRVTISVTAPKMIQEFHFDKVTMGLIFSAFAYTYALFQIIGGSLGDRFGPRRVLAILMGWWSAFTILTGIVSTFASLFIVRLLFGLGEAGGFPVATRALASWFPPTNRGILQGTTHAASRLGAAFAAPVIVAIVIFFGGWRWAFYLLGILGFVWAICFFLFFRDKPAEIAAVNESEMAIIRSGRELRETKPVIPWRRILRSKDVWALTFTYFTYGYTLWIYLTWLPTYLTEGRHFSFAQLGIVASLPLVGGILGDFAGGWACDALYRKTGNLNFARRSLIVISFVGTVAFVVPSALVASALLSEILTIGALFMLECAVSVCWAISMDLGGEHFSGSVSSVMNTGSGIASIVAPLTFAYLAQSTGSWFPGFAVGSVLLVIGAFTILLVNAKNAIEPLEDETPVPESSLVTEVP
ncbi:MAG TPA: MFS transporter [Ktedonobacteraceae bacterium]|nr:MFS transporter [Ktedonobacteraceae bacterium]